MKRVTVLLLAYLASLSISAQVVDSVQMQGKWIPITSVRDRVSASLASGERHVGKIKGSSDGRLLLTKRDGTVLVFSPETVQLNRPENPMTYATASVGLGIPNGAFGFNLEARFPLGFAMTAGLGTAIFTGPAGSCGIRFYPIEGLSAIKKIPRFSPRIGGFYGNNAVLVILNNYGGISSATLYSGISLTVGGDLYFGMRKRLAFSGDVVGIVSNGGFYQDLWRYYPGSRPSPIRTALAFKVRI